MSSSSSRPVTSKPRGICRYYNVPRGCFAGDKCKFLHGEPPLDARPEEPPLLTPYDKAKRCRYYAQGFCKRGDACWFLHTADAGLAAAPPLDEDEEELCSICFEKPTTYGLLGGCSHIFCTTCIKQWRDPQNKPGGVLDSGNTKKCPMCRAPSKFITPSSKFWKEGTVEKATVTLAYKESMARVPCRYFQKSIQRNKDKPICPYGKDCFYQHLKEDGSPYIFKDGIDVCMRRYRLSQARGRGLPFDDIHFLPFLGLSNLDVVIPNMMAGRPFRTETEAQDDGSRGNANGVAYAARRLREVGRSLEIFNDAMGDGASLDSLDFAVEALRAGLGRLEGTNNNSEARFHRRIVPPVNRGQGNRDEAAVRQEDDVMERLELLADQMLASISALRMNGDNHGDGSRAGTPPPPLEPIGTPARDAGTPPPPLIPAIERRHGSMHHGDDSDNESMPGLQSVSNSSEDEMDVSDDDSEESSDDFAMSVERRALELAGMHFGDLFEGWASSHLASARGSGEDTPGGPAAAESRPSSRFRTFVDRDHMQESSSRTEDIEQPDSESESDLPDLQPIETAEPAAPLISVAAPTAPTPEAVPPSPSSNADPPFVTDGRGRVVWTRPGEENKQERRRETEETTGTGSGSSGGTGRSFLGWFNALF